MAEYIETVWLNDSPPYINETNLNKIEQALKAAYGLVGTALLKSDAGATIAELDQGTGRLKMSQVPSALIGGLNFQGAWNPSTNSPALASGVGTKGHMYRVNADSVTPTIDGYNNWKIGDVIAFDGTVWVKFDNTEITQSATEVPFAGGTGWSAAHVDAALRQLMADTEKTANKNTANGYAGLDANGFVVASRLASGTRDGTKFLRDDGTWQPINSGGVQDATESTKGVVQFGTEAQVQAGTTGALVANLARLKAELDRRENRPVASLSKTAAQAINTASAIQQVTFDNIIFNRNGIASLANSGFVVPTGWGGVYLIHGELAISGINQAGRINTQIRVNGTSIDSENLVVGATSTTSGMQTFKYAVLAAGDVVTFWADLVNTQDAGWTFTPGTEATVFDIHYIRS